MNAGVYTLFPAPIYEQERMYSRFARPCTLVPILSDSADVATQYCVLVEYQQHVATTEKLEQMPLDKFDLSQVVSVVHYAEQPPDNTINGMYPTGIKPFCGSSL